MFKYHITYGASRKSRRADIFFVFDTGEQVLVPPKWGIRIMEVGVNGTQARANAIRVAKHDIAELEKARLTAWRISGQVARETTHATHTGVHAGSSKTSVQQWAHFDTEEDAKAFLKWCRDHYLNAWYQAPLGVTDYSKVRWLKASL